MNKYISMMAAALIALCSSCDSPLEIPDTNPGNQTGPVPPVMSGSNTDVVIKPKAMWIDAHANFSRLATKENVDLYLNKIKETGFNMIYLDVKPNIGYALYESDILPKLTVWGSEKVERDWDYCGYILEKANELGLDVVASISAMGFGSAGGKEEGFIYDSNKWNGKTQMMMVGNNPSQLVDIRNQTGVDAAMLNPSDGDVQALVISICEEIIRKYPKLKGISLDYLRWYGGEYGMEPTTIASLEASMGVKINNLNEIITASGGIGPKYSHWIHYRSSVITSLISTIRDRVKAINPDAEIHLWASAQWSSRYSVGQNWASKRYIPSGAAYTDNYNETGFADLLDVFIFGAYTEYVWKKENPASEWTVEGFCDNYNKYLMDDCKGYGSISNYGLDLTQVSDAVYLCLLKSDGLMTFELSHVINRMQWEKIKEGIDRYERK